MNLIHNERTKLAAAALNNTTVATIVTAIVAPVVGFLYGSPTASTNRWWFVIGVSWFFLGLVLDMFAQRLLGTEAMTDLQLYLLIAPLVLLATGAALVYFWPAGGPKCGHAGDERKPAC